jgi:hypothetical protein
MLTTLSRFWNQLGGRAFKAAAHRPSSGTKNRRVTLEVENLEERAVPAIVFRPSYGSETLNSNPHTAMVSPPVNLIFWGPYWGTQQGSQDASALISDVQTILNSKYVSGLTQYGSDGQASFRASFTDLSYENRPYIPFYPDAGHFNLGDVQNLVNSTINNPSAPIYEPMYYTNRPIYVVVTDPLASPTFSDGNNYGGYNWIGNYTNSNGVSTPTHLAWISSTFTNGGIINQDYTTTVFSHELVESMSVAADGSSWVGVTPPSPFSGNQISDGEADGKYVYRLGGVQVQAYWSDSDKAFIVPDGNAQRFYVDPVWNRDNSFTRTFDLSVKGDQLFNPFFFPTFNDVIGVTATATGSTGVTLNGESANFDAMTIRTINIDTGAGTNTVIVGSVAAGVTLNVDSSAGGGDTVVVGAWGSLAGIAGTVNISNWSGQTNLVIDASNDGAQSITVNDHSVAVNGLATINYQAGFTGLDGNTHGVTGLTIWDGLGANQIEVDSVAALTAVTIQGDTQDVLTGDAVDQVFTNLYRT